MQSKLESKIQEQWGRSKIIDLEKENALPRFTMEQLEKGKFLGKGGFCTVDEIKRFHVGGAPPAKKGSDEEVKYEDREFIIKHTKRAKGDARYAIKYLSPEVIKDESRYWQGLMDFATETHFLTAIDHPNIVKLRAIAEGTPFSQSYFLVLDRLYDILDKKIPKWAQKSKKIVLDRGGKKSKALLEERLVAAADLSDALGFMHRHNIVYRDIKADNIGFNFQGKITLFDFGLPRELHDEDRLEDGTWKLSGHTGTLRYMAPEVFKSVPYNYSCDVYSFSVLLWEMMAMERAYSAYGLRQHQERVLLGGRRPRVSEKWPVSVQDAMQKGWSEDTSARPSMGSMTQVLREEVARMQGKNPGQEILENKVAAMQVK